MTKETPTDENKLLPLERLIKIPRGKRRVDIDAETLRRVDLALLKHTVKFELNHPLDIRVELRGPDAQSHLEAKASIVTRDTEWPDPNEEFVDLFYAAVSAAAQAAIAYEPMNGVVVTSVYAGAKPAMFATIFNLPVTGEEILATLVQQVNRIQQEIPNILSVIAAGPKPGSSEPSDGYDDDDEEIQDD